MHACVCVFFLFFKLCRSFNSKFGLLVCELNLYVNSVSIPLESMNIMFFLFTYASSYIQKLQLIILKNTFLLCFLPPCLQLRIAYVIIQN